MGAWGTGIFEDDSSLDLIYEIRQSGDPKEFFTDSFQRAIVSDYLEYDDCHAVIVSAVCIDAINNGTHYDNEDLKEISGKNKVDVSILKADAIKALDLVIGDKSELNELWAENEEDYPAWRQNIIDLISRLQ